MKLLGCRSGGEEVSGTSRRRNRRRRRKRGKAGAASPPRGRGIRNRSPTSWRRHRLSCNDKNTRVLWGLSWSPEAEKTFMWMNSLSKRRRVSGGRRGQWGSERSKGSAAVGGTRKVVNPLGDYRQIRPN